MKTPSQSSMPTSADQFRDAVPARVSRPASSASQSDTKPELSLGLGTATPLEQSPVVCACTRPASPATSSVKSSAIDIATDRNRPRVFPGILRLEMVFNSVLQWVECYGSRPYEYDIGQSSESGDKFDLYKKWTPHCGDSVACPREDSTCPVEDGHGTPVSRSNVSGLRLQLTRVGPDLKCKQQETLRN